MYESEEQLSFLLSFFPIFAFSLDKKIFVLTEVSD